MSPDNEKEVMDRLRRIESRMVAGFQAMNVDLLEIVRQSQPELHDTPPQGKRVTVYTLDVPIARIRKAVRETWPGHAQPVPIYFEGTMVSAVVP